MIKNETPTDFFEHNERVKNFYEKNRKVIEKLLEEMKNKIGEGSTAYVFFLDSNEEICLKILKQSKDITADFHNDVETEVYLMNILDGLDEEVRTPKPYITGEYFKDEKDEEGIKFILMERIHGHSIRDILSGNGTLPPGFSIDSFRREITSYIKKMHEKNIYHRDLSEANIMIDENTGDFYVIDLGASTLSFGEDNPYIQERGSKKPVIYTKDEDNIIAICNSIRVYMLTSKE